MTTAIFDPRDSQYKTPYGAVPCGAKITVTLRPDRSEKFSACSLVLFEEFADAYWEQPLTLAGEETGRTLFTGSYDAPDQPELIWYGFHLRRENGEDAWLGKNGFCQEKEIAFWQQTVYDGTLSTPDWFGRGVTYQIFPDRFRRTAVPDPAGMLGNRVVHQNWDEGMEYLPNAEGEIQNRDFFGGNLAGVEEKLEYLKYLGVNTLYFCPIFEADSNHRYNTGDYETIDPMLGTEEDFRRLCEKAHALGIRVMLDGVFNHTGSNSRYFNINGEYPGQGAFQSQKSPYYPWYAFLFWPHRYDAWWGIKTLPAVNETCPSYMDYIIRGKDSIIRRWLRSGADAWRLDVADELPDDFIAQIRTAMMEEKPDSFLLGEVWEDGSNKIAYDQRRQYLLGRETHGLMNYPFRVAALAYLLGGPAEDFTEAMETIRENYPRPAFYSAMNLLGTHDTPRVLTLLGTGPSEPPMDRTARAEYRMTAEERERGLQLLRAAAVLLFAFPGSPMVYYGDEAGMEGFEDPFNRGTFPWGHEDQALQKHFALLGKLRNVRVSMQSGDLRWLWARGHVLAFAREEEAEITVAILNVGSETEELSFPWPKHLAADALSGQQFVAVQDRMTIRVPGMDCMLLI
ncbi:MAG: glycoside hydrolase family 13 protein [Oscillibacter sp.]|nr:glycoside hydrolase family 13 protein [Oscillibacter sp.]